MSNAAPEHLSISERTEIGQAARRQVPRHSHGEWLPSCDRADPISLLEQQGGDRYPELLAIRYSRMSASPFAFYRGGAYIMAADLAGTPSAGFSVQLCGDAHLSNFGGFASPDRAIIFDLNDFDETLPGPWEWDVKRMAASFAVSSRQLGLGAAGVLAAVRGYRIAMREFAAQRSLDVWYSRTDAEDVLEQTRGRMGKRAHAVARRGLIKARGKDRMRALNKLTRVVDGEPRLISDPPLIVPIDEMANRHGGGDRQAAHAHARNLVNDYRDTLAPELRQLLDNYRYVDMARKVVGVGSVGTRAWVILMLGRDNADPLFLQVKEAQPSVLEQFTAPSQFHNAGERVVHGQRLMQAAGDILLGWLRSPAFDAQEPRDYYVRQLWDCKMSVDLEVTDTKAAELYGDLCGRILARAHARSGDSVAIAHYLGTRGNFDEAVAEFATRYADQNERDHAALVQAIADGRVATQSEGNS